MKNFLLLLLLFSLSIAKEKPMSIYDFDVTTITGETISMTKYKDKVLLIVNVASKCGFTPQYEGLEALYKKYKDQGLVILGFPSNQFSNQEPGNNEEIQQFCTLNYGVSFDMFSKIDVNGDNTHPLYNYLKEEATGVLGSESIKWNFTKFLVTKDGKVYDRYGSVTKPESLEEPIEKLLNQ